MTVDRVAFTVFGMDIYWYGVLIALGVVLGAMTAALREKRQGLPHDTVIDFVLVCMPLAIVCARAYYIAFEWEYFAGDIRKMLDLRSGGLAIYGGVLGGTAAVWLVSRVKKVSFRTLADVCAPSLALGQAIGRWGNFANQEAYGYAVTSPAWRFFPASVFIQADGQWHLATFFYESAWCFLIWLVLEVCIRRGAFEKRAKGDVLLWYVLLYSAERAVVEGLRTDSLYWGGVRVSQAFSAVLLIAVVVLFAVRSHRLGLRPWALIPAAACGIAAAVLAFAAVQAPVAMLLLCAVPPVCGLVLYRQAKA